MLKRKRKRRCNNSVLACLKTYSAVPFSSVQGGIDALENADVIYTHSGHPFPQRFPHCCSRNSCKVGSPCQRSAGTPRPLSSSFRWAPPDSTHPRAAAPGGSRQQAPDPARERVGLELMTTRLANQCRSLSVVWSTQNRSRCRFWFGKIQLRTY